MAEPYTIRIFVIEGEPGGAKVVDRLNWTGLGLAFPRSAWSRLSKRSEFERSGVYILTGTSEGATDDLPTVYVGQGDEIRTRLEQHHAKKDFRDWGFIFVSKAEPLNRAHTTWLEHSLIHLAKDVKRCH